MVDVSVVFERFQVLQLVDWDPDKVVTNNQATFINNNRKSNGNGSNNRVTHSLVNFAQYKIALLSMVSVLLWETKLESKTRISRSF